MDANGLPLFGPQIDYSKVEPIERKWILGHFNNFLLETVHLLNTFSATCETKLRVLNLRLQNIEAGLTILETKLASIPGLAAISNQSHAQSTEAPPLPPGAPAQAPPPPISNEIAPPTPIPSPAVRKEHKKQEESAPAHVAPPQDPRLMRYHKMIQFGVPVTAVKLKMRSEGVDPSLLDNPSPGVPNVSTISRAPSDSSSLNSRESSDTD